MSGAVDMANTWEFLASAMLIIGGVFLLIGSVGLARLPDFLMRLHAPTKATTLGIGTLLLASMIIFSIRQGYPSIHEFMITVFIIITAPITAHMLAKVALHLQLELKNNTRNKELFDTARNRKPPANS
jgi:multicomponent K+:H+ antiporter subunit G